MSELIQKHDNRATIRWKLLTGASALALAAYLSSPAQADDAGRPQIWIELSGQFSQQDNSLEVYDPSFLIASPFDAASHVDLEKGPPKIWDKGAKITYQPDGSDWVLSLGVRYGKSARSETLNHLTTHGSKYSSYYHRYLGSYAAYQNFKAQSAEGHAIVDFQVGKDIGLGMFGGSGHSVLSAGVRIAQFNSRGAVEIQSQPTNLAGPFYYHIFRANFDAKRRYTGIGPSLSWDASANIAGNSSSSSLSLDWGVNAALLFGRQRMKTHHETTDNYKHYHQYISTNHTSGGAARSKNVTVPNLGGFAAVSWRYADAKISMGYRADMFFGAIDGGIDAAKKENRGFYGPFAGISIGIGD